MIRNERILLLRKEEENDKYHAIFKDHGYKDVTQIPALDFTFCNIEKFQCILRKLHKYSGIVFTSKRAVDAFYNAVDNKSLEKMKQDDDFLIYVVGPSCGVRLLEEGFHVVGSECGNAEELATLIVSHRSKLEEPLLFPCGNLAKETIPKRLQTENIAIESQVCYTTVPCNNFVPSMKKYNSAAPPWVLVFFSPSGVQYHFKEIEEIIEEFEKVKIVCIGKTTETAVLELGKTVTGVAKRPNPLSLLDAINSL